VPPQRAVSLQQAESAWAHVQRAADGAPERGDRKPSCWGASQCSADGAWPCWSAETAYETCVARAPAIRFVRLTGGVTIARRPENKVFSLFAAQFFRFFSAQANATLATSGKPLSSLRLA